MSYQVLARKWRPRKFAEMVGQEHVLQALINALDRDRLHHAYLFTGTRGVGKTTVARIFAKSLNCESGVSAEPCGECAACVEIDEGRFVDLIEVDAASRTKVEDTRELLDNVQYAPTRGRFKVYLVDEVHMLSAHSFNALLKTLEEPPPHVKFLLATTDPQKLPATVLSRCLQFNLKRMTVQMITGHLEKLLAAEKVEHDVAALRLIGRGANGSMRDALSLLDQAIAFGGGQISEPEVRAMLGTMESGHVLELLQALACGDGKAMLEVVERLSQQTPDYEALLADLLGSLQQIAIAQTVPEAVDEQLLERESLLQLAQQMSPEDVQLWYQVGLIGRRDLPLSPDLRGGLEMVLLRMLVFRPDSGEAEEVRAEGAPVRNAARPQPGASARAVAVDEPETAAPFDGDWAALVQALPVRGMVEQLAMNCSLDSREGDLWRLSIDPAHAQLLGSERQDRLQKALSGHLRQSLRIDIQVRQSAGATPAGQQRQQAEDRQAQAVASIEADPNVKAIQDAFDATLHAETVRPADQH